MNANKTLLAAAITMAVSFSCKKNDSGPAPQKTILSTVNYSAVGTYTYTYDNSNMLQTEVYGGNASNPVYTATIRSYDTKGRVVEVKAEYPSFPSYNYKMIVSYNDDGKIERRQRYDYTGANIGYTQFFYSAGTVSTKQYSAAGTLISNDESTFSADGANVVTYKTFNASGTLLTTTDYSNFDSKKTTDALLPYGDYDYPANKNNWQAFSRKVNSTGAVSSFTASYEYNDDGYPLKRTASNGANIVYAYLKK
jgi:hypothetical protein